jgi:apolipoprotein D and lipocalin family protein
MRAATGFITLLLVALSGCTNPPLDVAPNVDLHRFQGKWYEIARLPRPTEQDCTATTAYYSMATDGQVTMVNECHVGNFTGALRSVSTSAKVTDPNTPAKLSLDFGGFYGDYWIIDVGDRYEYAVVGHPTRQYLWVLSRTPTLDKPTLDGILNRAHDKKFETSRLEYTQQPVDPNAPAWDGDPSHTPGPEGTPGSPPSYGCSFSRSDRSRGLVALIPLVVVLGATRRRRRLGANES